MQWNGFKRPKRLDFERDTLTDRYGRFTAQPIERGYCMMIGGEKAVVDRLDPIFSTLAPGKGDIPETPGRAGQDRRAEQGYIHAGGNGAGHFVNMVHNGIEYGLMQAYPEGFEIL